MPTTPPDRIPALFVSHGAAIFTTSPQDPTNRFLAAVASNLDTWRPTGILVVSAHFEAHPLRLTGAGALATIHDHPVRALYDVRYPAHGSAALTDRVQAALARGGIPSLVDPVRGLDHGAWVPLSLLRPGGDLPVLQLSLDAGGDPGTHVAIGAALASLRREGVLIIGSGGVTHNQDAFRRGFFGGTDPAVPLAFSREFDAWVSAIVTSRRGADRESVLAAYGDHPLAARAQPTNEHFLPLLVLCGAAGDDVGRKVFEGFQHSLSTSAFMFG